MKIQKTYIIGAIIIASIAVIGFFEQKNMLNDADAPAINASFYPLYFLASEIAGDAIPVHSITPSTIEPHEYEPTAADIAHLTKSTLFIHTGAHFESWGERLAALIDAEGGKTLSVITDETALPYINEQGKKDIDPHIWISPKHAITVAYSITTTLMELDPTRAKTYYENGERAMRTLAEIDKNYNRVLSTCTKKDFVTSHNAFGYLAHDYGLTQHAIAGISPDREPSPMDLASITSLVKRLGITHIFMEELGSPKLVETIARETGATVLVLSPLEGASGTENLYTKMNDNLENLSIALQCTKYAQ